MRLVKLVKLQKMCMDSEDGKTDMNTSDKAKRATPFLNALCDMYAICFQKKKFFHGWYESKSDTVACSASGYFKVLRILVTRALPVSSFTKL